MPQKVIFDTDPGVDDATALLLLHRHPAIDLVGITTVFGNSDIEGTTRNARYLAGRFGISAPIAQGAADSLGGQRHRPPTHVHGDNGLGNIDLEGVHLMPLDPRSAPQLIIDLVRQNPGEITLVAVGRMTNLAMAINLAPEIAGMVKQVVIMGGAFGFGGNNGNVSPVAEANIIGDPVAADIIFGAAWPVVAVGLDVTRQVILSAAEVENLAASDSEAAQFVAAISRHYMAYHERFGVDGLYVHDSSAVAYTIDPSLMSVRQGAVRVATSGIGIGQTILRNPQTWYPKGAWDDRPLQSVCDSVDASGVKALLLRYLT